MKTALTSPRLIIETNNFRYPKATLLKLDALNVELGVLYDLLRVAYEVHFMKGSSLGHIVTRIDEISKMRGGLVKHYTPGLHKVVKSSLSVIQHSKVKFFRLTV